MDYSWLHDDGDVESLDVESDKEESEGELEERLYSIVHHNDLSQPLTPALAKHYSVEHADNGDVLVTLNDSLEHQTSEVEKWNMKLEENNKSNHISEKHAKDDDDESVVEVFSCEESVTVGEDDVVFISEISSTPKPKNPYRRPRYSDINIDKFSEPIKEIAFSTPSDIDYFNFCPNFLFTKKNKRFANLMIPTDPIDFSSNWKTDANASYISVDDDENSQIPRIIEKITDALKKANPSEDRSKLHLFAQMLFKRKIKAVKRRERVKRKKASKKNGTVSEVDTSLDMSLGIQESFVSKHERDNMINRVKEMSRMKSTEMLNGSISLNISPFRPDPKTVDWASDDLLDKVNDLSRVKSAEKLNGSISLNISPFRPGPVTVDVASEDENSTPESKVMPRSSKTLTNSYIPTKWSKSMIKFYTKPSKKKMEMDLDKIIENMKKTTIAEDWWLDPRDRAGFYQRTAQGKQAGRKCANCFQRGHFIRECPQPKKIPACSLCGQYFHTDYSCPNKICLKCGVYTPNDAYNGECNTCYYSTFEYDAACNLCGQVSHRSAICTDFWRSFHATTEGEKIVPENVNNNKRKYCSNCARKGHFSHNCPFLVYSGEQVSPFVINYAATVAEKGSTEMVIPQYFGSIMDSHDADTFLQNLSDDTNAQIIVNQYDSSYVLRINGTFEQCKRVKTEIEGYVNTRKRKRHEHLPRRKKQRIR